MSVRDVVQAAAGVGGAKLYVEDVFSTYLYTGNSSTQTITNGIDLAGEGGLVWLKNRSQAQSNYLFDTENGPNNFLLSDLTASLQAVVDRGVTAFNSDGFNLGSSVAGNRSGDNYASWTFRKAPKFFDIVQYSGDNTTSRQISHNLGAAPAVIIVKCTNTTGNWVVYHKDLSRDGTTVDSNNLVLNATYSQSGQGAFGDDQYQTSTYFTLGRLGSGYNDAFNKSGNTYVAYLFAHNAGGFGDDGLQDIISCGSYTGTGVAGNFISLGYEPQWILIKKTSGSDPWLVFDNMRGVATGGFDSFLQPNTATAETTQANYLDFNATGFTLISTNSFVNDGTYIYIAIRRPMKTPVSGSEVFHVNKFTSTGFTEYTGVNFAPDMTFQRATVSGDSPQITDKLIGPTTTLTLNKTNSEATDTAYFLGGFLNNGVKMGTATNGQWNGWNPNMHYYFKRAPGFFDVVAYNNPGTYTPIPHNLGVVPELVIMKRRSGSVGMSWYVTGFSSGKYLLLESNAAEGTTTLTYTTHTSTTFKPFNEQDCVAYLFASLPGISKVGSYTGNGSSQTINCGFSAGARFVLIKRTDSTGDWYFWDTARGIVSANDPHLSLNTTAAEVTTDDSVDPDSTGFIVNQVAATNINVSSASYIYLAIA